MRFLLLAFMSLFLLGCPSLGTSPQVSKILIDPSYQPSTDEEGTLVDEYGNPYTVSEYDEDNPKRDRRGKSCNTRRNDRDSDLKVEELDYIDSHNFSDYEIGGRCLSGERVEITINGYPIDERIYCKSRRWKVNVDLTPLSQEEVISFEISSLDETFCEDVKVAFTSPKNYVAVPALEDYYESGFLVMKYEAKLEKAGINSRAISEAEGRPISSISYSDAQKLCTNNGTRYNLMSNRQWQNLARDIESVDENWSLGRARVIEGNILNCGVNRGSPKEASRSDTDDCGASSCNRGWDYNRRTHLLSSGELIWDVCGNVGEIMRDRYTLGRSFKDHVYNATGKIRDTFGPERKYNIVSVDRREEYFGLGYISISSSDNLIVRGSQGRYAGVFSTDISKKREGGRSVSGYTVGFRCVYLP